MTPQRYRPVMMANAMTVADRLFGRRPERPTRSAEEIWGERRQGQYALVFDEARRALDRQAAGLDGVRGRAGTLVAAASLVTSFTSSSLAIAQVGLPLVVALAAYFGIVFLAVVIMWPVRGWRIGPDTKRVLDDYIDRADFASLAELHRSLALHMQNWYDGNQRRLSLRLRLFSIACVLLLVEVLALVVELRGRP